MNVLITGGLGFLGSNLARLLVHNGDKVSILDGGPNFGGNYFNLKGFADKIQLIKADIANYSAVLKAVKNKDTIYCCAGQVSSIQSLENPTLDLHTNALGNLNILEACKSENKNASIIFTSSRTVYGIPKYLPIDENHPTNPFDGYGITKLAAENYFQLYHKHHDLKTCVLRLSNLYGPRQQLRTGNYQIIAWIYRRIVKEELLEIYGDGNQARDFIFVDDVCKAMTLADKKIHRCKGQIYNVGSGTSTSLNSLIKKISKITCRKSKIKYSMYPKARLLTEVKATTLSYKKIKKAVNWTPNTQLEDGLKIMHKFYSNPKIMQQYM